jgi:hypothetical protein
VSGRGTAGYVTVETVVIFPALFSILMTFIQVAELEVACLTATHAANAAARSAVVVLADDPKFYGSAVGSATGKRVEDITDAAKMPLRAVDDAPRVKVVFPDRTQFRPGDQVKVRVEYEYPCGVAIGKVIACGPSAKRTIVREATMPYQGAGYKYP